MAHATGFLKIVNDAKSRIKEWNVHETKKRLDAGEKMVLVDVREESEWARGHVAARPFAFLAHVHKHHFLARIEALLGFVNVPFLDPRFGIVHDLQETGCMCHRDSSRRQ